MALETKSQFYYGPTVDPSFVYIDFSEGGPEIVAQINSGPYAPQSFVTQLATQLSAVGGQAYSVSFNRTTRKITISAASNFELLLGTGTHAGSEVWSYLGFTGNLDLTGANSYTGDTEIGSVYKPQFFLLDYVPSEHRQESVDSTLNVSGSGRVEVVSFGNQRFMECNISLVNDYTQTPGSMLETNKVAVSEAVEFMATLVTKGEVEFMPDRDDALTYETLILETTPESSKGIAFKLKEMLDVGAGYYTTGRLTFRKVIA